MDISLFYNIIIPRIGALVDIWQKSWVRARSAANVVAPGAIETDFCGGRTRDNKEINAQIAGLTSLGRVGLPDDIGGVVAFLCSDEAKWINGQRIEVSGGIFL